MASSYKPFVISEFKTGLFNYLEPWIRPNDAFEPLQNAYVYRGSIFKRQGMTLFGQMAYCDNAIIAVGNGGNSYSGTITPFPIVPIVNGFTVTVLTSGGLETFTSNAATPTATLTGSLGDTGTFTWLTGAWTLTFGGGRTVAAARPIVAHYSYVPQQLTTPLNRPIMGIKQYINETTNIKLTVVMDTRRFSFVNVSSGAFTPVCTVSQQFYIAQGGVESVTLLVGWLNIAPYSVSITDGASTITDTPTNSTNGNLSAAGNFAAGGTVNYSTGSFLLNLGAGSVKGTVITITLSLQGDYFTGNNTNFFNATNWETFFIFTNNVDRVTFFDGTNLSRPPLAITQANQTSFTNDINTTLDVKVYKNRLLLIRPTVDTIIAPQSIRYSATFNVTNFVADVAGNGGELSAPTGDWIQAAQFLRDYLIVFFENSTWIFRFTGNAFDPFRFDKINSSKNTSAPYGSISYDERVTSMGNLGLIACDGVNVQRYDTPIIDQFDEINSDSFAQCFGQRFDQLNQSWMLFPQDETNSSTSDAVLVYNFIEDTWSTYLFNNPGNAFIVGLSCLGVALNTKDAIWNDFAAGQKYASNWQQEDNSWNSYLWQGTQPVLLGGDQYGNVFILNEGTTDLVGAALTPTTISANIISTRWNPFIGVGARTTFGYIDLYYKANADCSLTITFYVDDSSAPAIVRNMTLTAPPNDNSDWQRIYVGLTGEFVQMQIQSDSQATFQIIGAILWAREDGRLSR